MAGSPTQDIFDFDDATIIVTKKSQGMKEKFKRNFVCLNITNLEDDQSHVPLYDRVDLLSQQLISVVETKPDVLFILEAGRPSGAHDRWTRMALRIEEITGLTYESIYYDTADASSSGKAIFVNRSRIAITNLQQYDVNHEFCSVDGSCIIASFHPVVEEECSIKGKKLRVITKKERTVGVFQMTDYGRSRDIMAVWLRQFVCTVDVLMVDFNITSKNIFDVNVNSLIKKMTGTGSYQHLMFRDEDGNMQTTYHALEHHAISTENLIDPPLQTWTLIDDGKKVLVSAASDHLFCNRTDVAKIIEDHFILPMKQASDHDAIGAKLIF